MVPGTYATGIFVDPPKNLSSLLKVKCNISQKSAKVAIRIIMIIIINK